MEQIISKEELQEFMKLKGEARGIALKTEADFIIKEKGREGLKKLEEAITQAGYPLSYNKLRPLNFYPLGLEIAILVTAQRLFNWDDQMFYELGKFEPKGPSLIIRLFVKHFSSVEKLIGEVAKMWDKYYSIGKIEVEEYNKEERRITVTVKDFSAHPLLCLDFSGFFASVLQMAIKDNVTCEETKCIHKGDKYHEFLLKW